MAKSSPHVSQTEAEASDIWPTLAEDINLESLLCPCKSHIANISVLLYSKIKCNSVYGYLLHNQNNI